MQVVDSHTGGEPTRVVIDDTPVMVLRENESFYALHDRCSHRGCSLADGDLDGNTLTCACHGSQFDAVSGAVKRGPAERPLPGVGLVVKGGYVHRA